MDTVGLVPRPQSLILGCRAADGLFAGHDADGAQGAGLLPLARRADPHGPWGLAQPIADAIKAFVKEDIDPGDADKLVFRLAPIICVFTALAAWCGHSRRAAGGDGRACRFRCRSPIRRAGCWWPLAFTALAYTASALAGWASQSKYSLLGAMRAAAQLISYELSMGHEHPGRA